MRIEALVEPRDQRVERLSDLARAPRRARLESVDLRFKRLRGFAGAQGEPVVQIAAAQGQRAFDGAKPVGQRRGEAFGLIADAAGDGAALSDEGLLED